MGINLPATQVSSGNNHTSLGIVQLSTLSSSETAHSPDADEGIFVLQREHDDRRSVRHTLDSARNTYRRTKHTASTLGLLLLPLWTEFKKFCLTTNTHGLKKIFTEPRQVLKVYWFIVCFTVVSCELFHLSMLIQRYYSHQTNQGTSFVEENVPFPSVTVCNNEVLSRSARRAAMSDPNSPLSTYQALVKRRLVEFSGNTNSAPWNLDEYLTIPPTVFQNLNSTDISNLGHNQDDFIISCSYAGEPCNMLGNISISPFLDSHYYNCFTISITQSGIDIPGPMNGLSLILFLENSTLGSETGIPYNQASHVDNSVGVRVSVNSPGTLPFMRDEGFDASPGFSVSVGMTLEEMVMLGQPYSSCFNQADDRLPGQKEYTYSASGCLALCYANYVFDKCGCISAFYPVPDHLKDIGTFCAYLNVSIAMFLQKITCETNARRDLSGDISARVKCGCDPPCDHFEYIPSISQALWPSSAQAVDFYRGFIANRPNGSSLKAFQLKESILNETDQERAAKIVRRQFVRLNIFLQSLTVKVSSESVGYSVIQMLSDIGGAFGLWAGHSVITITIETTVLFIGIFLRYVTFCKNNTVVNLHLISTPDTTVHHIVVIVVAVLVLTAGIVLVAQFL